MQAAEATAQACAVWACGLPCSFPAASYQLGVCNLRAAAEPPVIWPEEQLKNENEKCIALLGLCLLCLPTFTLASDWQLRVAAGVQARLPPGEAGDDGRIWHP